MKKSLLMVVFAVFLVCSIALIGCTPEELDDLTGGEGVDTPFEAYNYFADSIVKLLSSSETIEVESTQYNDDEKVLDSEETIYQKSGAIILAPNAYNSPKAYYDGKMYFRENFTSFATTSLKQFVLASFFRSQYELETFLFADTVTFTDEGEGHKLVVVVKLTPHVYSYELITDANDNLVSVKLTNNGPGFVVETRMNTKALSGALPSAETLLGNNDETTLWENAATLSSAVYLYSQSPELKKQGYTSVDGNGYSLTPIETYNINATQVLFTDDKGGYGYLLNRNFYTNDTEAEATYDQKTYAEDIGVNTCKYFMIWDLIWPMYEIEEEGLTVTQDSPVAGQTKYVSGDYSFVLSASGLSELITYNEYDNPAYVKYVLSTDADEISAPSGFNATLFLSDNQVSVIRSIDTALTQCNNEITSNLPNPTTQTELSEAMYINPTLPHILTTYPETYSEEAYYIIVTSGSSEEDIKGIIAIVYGDNGIYYEGKLGSGSKFEYSEYTGP